jgi:hypothetical protein
MVGVSVVDPITSNVSVQVPSVGCAVVNDTKSKLKKKELCTGYLLFISRLILITGFDKLDPFVP